MVAAFLAAAVAAVAAVAGRLELSRVILRDIEKRVPSGTRFSMVDERRR